MEVVGPRERLLRAAAARGDKGLPEYRAEHNHTSIDGIPGF
jgi:hypothetical protein